MTKQRLIRLRLEKPITPSDLAAHPVVAAGLGKSTSAQGSVIYYDTHNLELWQRGSILSLCHQEEAWLQRIGPVQTEESLDASEQMEKITLKSATPHFSQFKEQKKSRKYIGQIPIKSLEPLFAMELRKTRWTLTFPESTRLLLILEEGQIQHNNHLQPFCELLLYYKSGDPLRFHQTALALAHDFSPLLGCAAPEIRFFLGLHPKKGINFSYQEIKPPKSGTTAETALTIVCRDLVQAVRHALCPLLHGQDEERFAALEQFRAMVTRIRVLLDLYRPLLPQSIRADLDSELNWLMAETGPAWLWDLFSLHTLKSFMVWFAGDGEPNHSEFLGLTNQIQAVREKTWQRSISAISSFRFTRLILGLENWLASLGWQPMIDLPQKQQLNKPVKELSLEALHDLHRAIPDLMRSFPDISENRLRSLIDATSMLADLVWFFSQVYVSQHAKTYAIQLNAFLNSLRRLEELQRAGRLIKQIVSPADHPTVHLARGWLSAIQMQRNGEVIATGEQFLRLKPFWI
ncbi:MAG: CHAD domain-containing protein [Magnetococcus sp. DMHC-6]